MSPWGGNCKYNTAHTPPTHPLAGDLMSGMVGCQHYTLVHQVEHFGGVVILTCRQEAGYMDLNELPKLRCVGNHQYIKILTCVCLSVCNGSGMFVGRD